MGVQQVEKGRRWPIGDIDGDAYDARFDRLAQDGEDVHGEAALVERLKPGSVLDAGCGTGRVARELARRGVDVVGVDVDAGMIATARRRAPELEWHVQDLVSVDLERLFDVVLMAGNVMIFLDPGSEGAVLANMSRHLFPGGLLVTGFQLGHSLTIEDYDELASRSGLQPLHRWATWDQQPWQPGGDYAVSVHERIDLG